MVRDTAGHRLHTGPFSIEKIDNDSFFVARHALTGQEYKISKDEYTCLVNCRIAETQENHIKKLLALAQAKEYAKVKKILCTIPGGNFVWKPLRNYFFAHKRFSTPRKDHSYWKQIIDSLHTKGLLISDDEVHTLLKNHPSAKAAPADKVQRSSFIGIPTKGRPKALKQSLTTLINNVQKHGHKTPITVVDDSTDKNEQTETKKILNELAQKTGHSIRYADRESRSSFAKALSEKSGAPLETARFALLGIAEANSSPEEVNTVGGSRNTLLLEGAGGKLIEMDDDLSMDTRITDDVQNGVSFNNNQPFSFYQYDASLDKAKQFGYSHEIDMVNTLLNPLGRHPLKQNYHQDTNQSNTEIDAIYLDRLLADNARVRLNYIGSYGASGMEYFHPIAFSNYSHHSLHLTDASYETAATHPYQARGVSRPNIFQNRWCSSMIFGLDATELVPFFSPVARSQDMLFGKLLYECFPDTFASFVPGLVCHDRTRKPYKRSSSDYEQFFLRANQIVIGLIDTYCVNRWKEGQTIDTPAKVDHCLTDLGTELCTIANTDRNAFITVLQDKMASYFEGMRIGLVSHFLEQDLNITPHETDLLRFIRTTDKILDAFHSDNFLCDMPGTHTERVDQFRDWLRLTGDLAQHWSGMHQAAIELRDQGVSASEPVQIH